MGETSQDPSLCSLHVKHATNCQNGWIAFPTYADTTATIRYCYCSGGPLLLLLLVWTSTTCIPRYQSPLFRPPQLVQLFFFVCISLPKQISRGRNRKAATSLARDSAKSPHPFCLCETLETLDHTQSATLTDFLLLHDCLPLTTYPSPRHLFSSLPLTPL